MNSHYCALTCKGFHFLSGAPLARLWHARRSYYIKQPQKVCRLSYSYIHSHYSIHSAPRWTVRVIAGLACNLSLGDLLRRRIIPKNQKNYVNCLISVCIDCPSKFFTLCGAHLLQHAQTLVVVSHPITLT